jgi:hypothetical protein
MVPRVQTVAVGVIKATTPKEAAGVTTKAAQKVEWLLLFNRP